MAKERHRVASDLSVEELVAELQSVIDKAGVLIREVQGRSSAESSNVEQGVGGVSGDIDQLRSRLAEAETDLQETTDRMVEVEHQRGRLMGLYVATCELHETLDLEEVKRTVGEIAIDLLGADSFALLIRRGESDGYEVAVSRRTEGVADGLFAGPEYTGGDPMVDDALVDGVLRTATEEGSNALAVVPLTIKGTTMGALVILKLLEHKPSLTSEDRDLLDLLAAHAASALFAAQLFVATDRKLRTLEDLVEVVRGG
ncbi:MAG: GAF domain-containing protein [Thermoanaerobaculia bacterium]